tara:strand:- start:450 stop:1055 length:606 start_codon:yes stop_codon:yes gene_type:complete
MALSAITVNKCDRTAGGIKRMFVADAAEIASFNFNNDATNHDIIDFVFDSGFQNPVYFKEISFKKSEARYEVSQSRDEGTGVDTAQMSVFVNIPAPSSAQLAALESLRNTCELVVIVQEFGTNTLFRVLGADQSEFGTMEFMSLSGGSGAARTDANTYELQLMGEQTEAPYILESIFNSSQTPSTDQAAMVTFITSDQRPS